MPSEWRSEAKRKVRRTHPCATQAQLSLRALPAVGLTERVHDSLCLVFHELGFAKVLKDCCARADRCPLFDARATRHSAQDRQPKATKNAPNTNNSSYLDAYLADDVLLAATYQGNTLDCALYDAAVDLVRPKLAALEDAGFYVDATPLKKSAICARARAALARLAQNRA